MIGNRKKWFDEYRRKIAKDQIILEYIRREENGRVKVMFERKPRSKRPALTGMGGLMELQRIRGH